jgi:hypothetical protein
MSLFGVGATGGSFGNPAGTTLGRSGFGYIYPGFNAQFTYSTPQALPVQLTVGAFDPSVNNGFTELLVPRLEAEVTSGTRGALLWAGGLLQPQRDAALHQSTTAWGVTGGARIQAGQFTVLGSGYLGSGIGATLLFEGGRADESDAARLRHSSGYLAQVTWARPDGPLTLGLSWGESYLRSRGSERFFRTRNESVTGGVYYRPTPSLRVVGEATFARSNDADALTRPNRSVGIASGLMLFF